MTVKLTLSVFANIIFIEMSTLITYTQAVHNCDSFQTHLNWHVTVHVLQLTIPK